MTKLSECLSKMVNVLPKKVDIESTAFEEGFSNEVYLIRWENAPQWVLRLPMLDVEAFYINRQYEMRVLHAAVEQGLSPAIIWHDNDGCVASKFVSQPTLDWSVRHTDDTLTRIARALAKTHQLSLEGHHYSILDVIKHYLDRIESSVVGNNDLYKEYQYLQSQLDTLPTLNSSLTPKVCHNDLNPKNILIDDDELWLIDWEYAGVGDPLFDLAVVVKSHNLDIRQTTLFLNAYQPSLASEENEQIVNVYTQYYSLREMAWLLLKYCVTPEDELSLSYYYEFKATPTLNPFPIERENS